MLKPKFSIRFEPTTILEVRVRLLPEEYFENEYLTEKYFIISTPIVFEVLKLNLASVLSLHLSPRGERKVIIKERGYVKMSK